MSRQLVHMPALFDKAETLKDNSVKLIFVTRELGGADMAQLFNMKGKEVWMVLAPDASLEGVEVPKERPDSGTGKKTQSQRLHSILYVWWKQLGEPGTFDDFYKQKTENIIDQIKEKLDGEEE